MKKAIKALVKRIANEHSSEDLLRMTQAVGILVQAQQTKAATKRNFV